MIRFIALLFLLPLGVSAQTLVADVSVRSDAFIQVDERSYEVVFTLSQGEGMQPGVRYALALVDGEGNTYAGVVSEEVLILNEGESVQKSIAYTAPEDLGGTYAVVLQVLTQDYFPLAYVEVAEVVLEGKTSSHGISLFEHTEYIENVRILREGVQVVATVPEEMTLRVAYCGSEKEVLFTPEMMEVTLPFETDCLGDIHVSFFKDGTVIEESVYVLPNEEQTNWIPFYGVAILLAVSLFLYVLYRKRKRVAPLTLLLVPFLLFGFSTEAAMYKERLGFSSQALGDAFGCNVLVRVFGPTAASEKGSGESFTIRSEYFTTDCLANMSVTANIVGGGRGSGSTGNGVEGTKSVTLSAPQNPGTYDINVSGGISARKATSGYASKSYPSTRSANPMFQVKVKEPVVPTAWLTANPTSITEGQSTTLEWGSEDASRCGSLENPLKTNGKKSGEQTITLNHAQTKVFKVSCDGAVATATVVVNEKVVVEEDEPEPPAPEAWFEARPTSVIGGSPVVVTWGSTHAYDCRGWNFATGGSKNGSETVYPNANTTYGVTCWEGANKSGRKVTASQYVAVTSPPSIPEPDSPPPSLEPDSTPEPDPEPPAAPTASLQVRNNTQGGSWTGANITILPGDQIALRWDSTNATSCNGSNFSTGGSDDGQTSSISEPSAGNNRVYAVSCSGSGGSDSDSLRVYTQAVDPTISVDSTRVREGEYVELTYNLQGNAPAGCTLRGPGIEATPSNQSGSVQVRIYGDSVFTLTCAGGLDEVSIELIPVLFGS
ncbi:hypothetical protein KTR10_02450 [Candidatus Kaiserbacteria bacterium]|nr:hypothetical protein [Candidatus Kaiserbacteria bacterium]